MNTLPISASQKALLTKAITLMPSFKGLFTQASDYLNMVGWLAGADAPRTFLIQTLDKGELRGTGGFEGFYSILNVDHGKVGSIVLQRANDLDYGTAGCGKGVNNWSINNPAPAAYVKWWPFANWGLRDANLNSDFPTSAKLIMNAYSHEACSNVDGVIQFTPEAIASVLRVTGPLQVPVFNETVTADNLEAKIHYYEESDAGIARAQALFHDFNPADKNKIRTRFTEAVEQLLETHVRHLPKSELIPLAKQFLADLRSKDVQVYFNNKSVEGYLQKLHADGAIDTTPGVDGLFVSQVNVSVSKGSPYVATTISDNVTLDTKGGASHQLRIAIKNNAQSGAQVAGYLTYRDYVRIYVPAGAQLQYADGFDSGKVMCVAPPTTPPVTPPTPPGPPTPPTPPTAPTCGSNPYPGGERVCPASQYLPLHDSESGYLKNAQPGNKPGTLNKVGGPTATTSDVPNLTMWGGYVVIPQYCTANLTLNYYVPNVVNKNSAPRRDPDDGAHHIYHAHWRYSRPTEAGGGVSRPLPACGHPPLTGEGIGESCGARHEQEAVCGWSVNMEGSDGAPTAAEELLSQPLGHFGTILADPPWRFQNRTGKMAPEHRRLSRYDTMTMDDIYELPVAQLALPKSHLYLWVPNALIVEGLETMKRWGFTYKTQLIWYKDSQRWWA